jgi:hypothetical protein
MSENIFRWRKEELYIYTWFIPIPVFWNQTFTQVFRPACSFSIPQNISTKEDYIVLSGLEIRLNGGGMESIVSVATTS